MKVNCILCNEEHELKEKSSLAKQLINHPIKVFLCTTCHKRIKDKTEKSRLNLKEDNA